MLIIGQRSLRALLPYYWISRIDMIYFISGHRDLTQAEFHKYYTPLINKIIAIDDVARFIFGDWEGCDTLAYNYILPKLQPHQTIDIYCVNKVRFDNYSEKLYPQVDVKMCDSYDACDKAMTLASDFDIAWMRPRRELSHTANNIKRRYNL
jgi:hypothetical protein